MSFIVLIPLCLNGPVYTFMYATQWGAILTALNFALCLWFYQLEDSEPILTATQVSMQCALVFEMVVSVVFWIYVAPDFLPLCTPIWWIGLVGAHTVPLGLVLVNYFLSREIGVQISHWWVTLLLAILYTGVNFEFCQVLAEPVYPFLQWKHPESALSYCLSFWLLGQAAFFALVYINNKFF